MALGLPSVVPAALLTIRLRSGDPGSRAVSRRPMRAHPSRSSLRAGAPEAKS